MQLRCMPHPIEWDTVRATLGLSTRALRQQRWLIAAQLVADGAGWTDAAAHPAVDFNPDTLRKTHATAKLPGGLSWGDYVEQYQTALRERTVELQQERGRDVAERLQALGERAMRMAEILQDHLEDCVHHPPAMVSTGPMQGFTTTEKRTQLLLLFPGEKAPEVDDGPPRDRLTLPYARYLRQFEDEIVALAARAGKLAHAPGLDTTADATPSEAELDLAALQAKAAQLDAELRGYTEGARGAGRAPEAAA